MKSMKRDNFTQLPNGNELTKIMEKEAFRAVPLSKQDSHYPDFLPAINLLKYYNLSTDVFTQTFEPQEADKVLDMSVPLIA